ncbi:hypothetical protein C7S18_15555 [Ahniella affigens]|uniref:Uncharacterized protein n=1 Tax=Ahniella affigens TaxID=2021234 RepID=A0A2P1PUJ9_9GAMM|nr:hypothetical protein [Ahniella affigens]AVP98514.1 hypothetical protein C7S18_15555 [Ahniella affigens]
MLRYWLTCLLCILSWPLAAAPPTEAELPAVLRDWQAWVRYDKTYRQCPAKFDAEYTDADDFWCGWPSRLTIDVGTDSASFSQTWELYDRSFVPLPGNSKLAPVDVNVDGNSAPVVFEDDQPGLWLDAGSYAITGRLRFAERPESIAVPESVARVALTVDGRAVFPLNRADGVLWLGRAEGTSVEADALSVQVFRLVTDGIPATLETRLQFEISGKGREEILPSPLPESFEPIWIRGDLSARLEADGSMHVQVRPGTFTVTLGARSITPLAEIKQTVRSTPWPPQEVWSYQANGALRVTEAGGPPQIDPNIAEVPSEWRQFPAYMLEGDTALAITENSRGLATGDANRLSLARSLWLDFDGGGWTIKDQIRGELKKDWRLNVREPIQIGRAVENGEPSLITRSVGDKALGVEVRHRSLSLDTTAREESGARSLPVTGWTQAFDSVDTYLQLPPGYKLWAALGMDRAPDAWLDKWDLLDVFFAVLTVVLFSVLFGRIAALVPLVYVAFAWHEYDAPRTALIVALVALAVARGLSNAGWFAVASRWVARIAVVVLLFISVPFAIEQIRYGLYPQLLSSSYGVNDFDGRMNMLGGMAEQGYAEAPPPPPPAPMPASAAPEPEAAEEQNVVQDADSSIYSELNKVQSLSRPAKKMKRYEANAVVVQNGYAEPSWTFHGYNLQIQGPVDPSQNMRLIISPPWLTAGFRFVMVAALVWVLLAMLLKHFKQTPPSRKLGFGLVLLMAGSVAHADEPPVPSQDVLNQLEARLLAAPECADTGCARLATVDVRGDAERVSLALTLEAASRVAVPLPGNESQLSIDSVSIDGVVTERLVRDDEGRYWTVLNRGVHRVQVDARIANVASVEIGFPMAPAWIDAELGGWEVSGINEGQLTTGSLNLTRTVVGDAPVAEAGVAQRFDPFVRVTRRLDFDLDWTVYTSVDRIAPQEGAFSVTLPLLAGERVLDANVQIKDGIITLPFADGQFTVSFESRLDAVPSLELDAPSLNERAEVWVISASPTWNVLVGGMPGVYPGDPESLFEYYPLPGERLNVQVTRPEAVPGGTIAFDNVSVQSRFAKRSVEHDLNLQWRATQGGQHGIVLPEGAEVLSVTINGSLLNLRPDKGVLRVPITPGNGTIAVTWRHLDQGAGLSMQTPVVDLRAPASNLSLGMSIPEDRWLIAARGPALGPAVLYWGELLVMLLLAYALSRLARTSIKLHEWILLGVGFSTVSWFALFVFAAWLYAIDWRKRLQPAGWFWKFDLIQLGLLMLTLFAVIALFAALNTGLIGQPDLHVISRGYGANDLKWFADLSDTLLPQGYAWTLPIWLYRTLMLAWALWMSWSLVRWGKAAMAAFLHEGAWQPMFAPKAPAAIAAATQAPAGADAGSTAPDGIANAATETNGEPADLPASDPDASAMGDAEQAPPALPETSQGELPLESEPDSGDTPKSS